VGRGSLGGPVSVGLVVVDSTTRRPPAGLRDSKLLAPAARESLVPRIEAWSCCWAIGHASAAEIDEIGILRALRLAGERALAQLRVWPDLVLLDGNYDWFTRPDRAVSSPTKIEPAQVTLKVKADLTCASVAAASVIAKVARDRHMVELAIFSRGTAGGRTRATRPRSTAPRCSRSGRAPNTEGRGTSSSQTSRRRWRVLTRHRLPGPPMASPANISSCVDSFCGRWPVCSLESRDDVWRPEMSDSDPWKAILQRIEDGASLIGLHPDTLRMLSLPERVLEVAVPIRRTTG